MKKLVELFGKWFDFCNIIVSVLIGHLRDLMLVITCFHLNTVARCKAVLTDAMMNAEDEIQSLKHWIEPAKCLKTKPSTLFLKKS